MVLSKKLDTLTMLGEKCKISRKPELKDSVCFLAVFASFITFLCLLILFTKDELVRNIKTNVYMCDKYGPPLKFETTQAATPRLYEKN